MNESYEMTFTLKDADMRKLAEIFGDININDCPYFEIQDKYGNSAKYYRENPPSAQPETHGKRTETHACDLISRQYAIANYQHVCRRTSCKECPLHICDESRGFTDCELELFLHNLPSAQPESIADAEFWRKRADYYSDMCSKLIADMGAGVKIEAVKIDETGITFTKKKPPAQPETNCSEIPNNWIPCSERLPEQYGNYLISIHGEDEPDIGTINPNDKRGWSLCDANGFHWASDKKLIVTAWMSLPEPYKERREE